MTMNCQWKISTHLRPFSKNNFKFVRSIGSKHFSTRSSILNLSNSNNKFSSCFAYITSPRIPNEHVKSLNKFQQVRNSHYNSVSDPGNDSGKAKTPITVLDIKKKYKKKEPIVVSVISNIFDKRHTNSF